MEDILSGTVRQFYNEKAKVVPRHSLSARIFISAWRKGAKLSFHPGASRRASKFRLGKISRFPRETTHTYDSTPLDTPSVYS